MHIPVFQVAESPLQVDSISNGSLVEGCYQLLSARSKVQAECNIKCLPSVGLDLLGFFLIALLVASHELA